MKRFFSLICVFLLISAVVSCGGKKKEKPAYEEQVTKEISASEGGTVESKDGKTSIEVPADALDENLTITMRIYDAEGYTGTEGQKVVSKVVEFEPSGTVFKKPVIITMAAAESFEKQVVTAAVYRESVGEWSYNEHGAYAVLAGRDAAGDPIMQSAAGDPIMLSAAGDPIMQSTGEGMAAAGDPIMLASAGDPIMSNAAGDPIMNAAAGDPIMMTTGHFTAYTFIILESAAPVEEPDEEVPESDEEITDEDDDDIDISDIEISDNDEDDIPDEEIPDEIEDADETPVVDEDIVVPEPDPVLSRVLCTGRTHCVDGYTIGKCTAKEGDDFYGQDGQFVGKDLCVPHKYKKGDPIENEETGQLYEQIIDENTGLRWVVLNEKANYEQAQARCSALTYGGYAWRIPTAKEFLSIADHDRNDYEDDSDPVVNTFFFRNMGSGFYVYWTSTPVVGEGAEGQFWNYYPRTATAAVTSYTAANELAFVCVSGEEYGKPGEFEVKNISGKDVVFDSATNLMWQKTPVSGKNWRDALGYCSELEYAGYSDWRVPNKNELLTLVDYSKVGPASSFPGMTSEEFWSSTFQLANYGGADNAYAVNIGGGTISTEYFGNELSVLCVRSDAKPLPAGRTIPYCDESRAAPCEDANTHYVWSAPDYSGYGDYYLSWYERALQCRESEEGGILQWRLPTIDEIRTLFPSDSRLKTGGECSVTVACSDYYSPECFDSICSASGEWTMSSLFDYYGYYLSGTLSGLEEDSEKYAWAVNMMNGSIVPYSSDGDYSESRCIKDDSIPVYSFPYTDTETHLIWSSSSKGENYWYDAAQYCGELVEGGSNNWRVPTMDELRTLVRNCPEGDCAPNMAGKYSLLGDISGLWSSTVEGGVFNLIDFMYADEYSSTSDYTYAGVRCVRREDDPVTVSTGIVFPFDAGDLIWSKVSDGILSLNYGSGTAAQYCADLNAENYGGYNNWALPTMAELATLVKKSVCTNKNELSSTASSDYSAQCDIITFDGYSIIGDVSTLIGTDGYFNFAYGRMVRSSYPDGFVRCVIRF